MTMIRSEDRGGNRREFWDRHPGLVWSNLDAFATTACIVLMMPFAAGEESSKRQGELGLGLLGLPFGSMVLIEGRILEGGRDEIPDNINDNGGRFLRVERIDGEPLVTSVVLIMQVDPLVELRRADLPEIGDKFALRGYEVGWFAGSPQDVWDRRSREKPPPSGWGKFRFQNGFRIVEILPISEASGSDKK